MDNPRYGVAPSIDFCLAHYGGTLSAAFDCLNEAEAYARKASKKSDWAIEVRKRSFFGGYGKLVASYENGKETPEPSCKHCGKIHDDER